MVTTVLASGFIHGWCGRQLPSLRWNACHKLLMKQRRRWLSCRGSSSRMGSPLIWPLAVVFLMVESTGRAEYPMTKDRECQSLSLISYKTTQIDWWGLSPRELTRPTHLPRAPPFNTLTGFTTDLGYELFKPLKLGRWSQHGSQRSVTVRKVGSSTAVMN